MHPNNEYIELWKIIDEQDKVIGQLRDVVVNIITAYDNAQKQDEYFGVSMDDEESIDEARELIDVIFFEEK